MTALNRIRAVGAVALCTVIAPPVHAYLDPGTGSIILQSVLAGIAVAMGILRLYWYRLKSFFAGLVGKTDAASGSGDPESGEDSRIRDQS